MVETIFSGSQTMITAQAKLIMVIRNYFILILPAIKWIIYGRPGTKLLENKNL